MRHRVKGKKFRRNKDSRKALTLALLQSFFKSGKIETTIDKAKYIRPLVEKVITKARVNDLSTRRSLIEKLQDKEIVEKLLDKVGPKFADRNGGYTRIQRTKVRVGDVTQMAILSYVDNPFETIEKKVKASAKKSEAKEEKAEEKAEEKKPRAKKSVAKKEDK